MTRGGHNHHKSSSSHQSKSTTFIPPSPTNGDDKANKKFDSENSPPLSSPVKSQNLITSPLNGDNVTKEAIQNLLQSNLNQLEQTVHSKLTQYEAKIAKLSDLKESLNSKQTTDTTEATTSTKAEDELVENLRLQVELRDREISQLRLELEEMKNIKLDEFVEFDNFSRSFDDHQPLAATTFSATAAGTPRKVDQSTDLSFLNESLHRESVRNSRLFQEYKRSKEETNHLRLLYKSLISRNRYLEKYFYYYQMNQQAQQAKKKQQLVEKREKGRVNFNAQMAMMGGLLLVIWLLLMTCVFLYLGSIGMSLRIGPNGITLGKA